MQAEGIVNCSYLVVFESSPTRRLGLVVFYPTLPPLPIGERRCLQEASRSAVAGHSPEVASCCEELHESVVTRRWCLHRVMSACLVCSHANRRRRHHGQGGHIVLIVVVGAIDTVLLFHPCGGLGSCRALALCSLWAGAASKASGHCPHGALAGRQSSVSNRVDWGHPSPPGGWVARSGGVGAEGAVEYCNCNRFLSLEPLSFPLYPSFLWLVGLEGGCLGSTCDRRSRSAASSSLWRCSFKGALLLQGSLAFGWVLAVVLVTVPGFVLRVEAGFRPSFILTVGEGAVGRWSPLWRPSRRRRLFGPLGRLVWELRGLLHPGSRVFSFHPCRSFYPSWVGGTWTTGRSIGLVW